MVVLELDQVEIDYCLDCGGIWLDAGELEALLENHEEAERVLKETAAAGQVKKGRRKCPICDKRMEIVTTDTKETVQIDRCRKNHGLWFDRGELEEVIRSFKEGKNEKVIRLLQDMFKQAPEQEGR